MTRGERREITYRKWISKLHKVWNTHLWSKINEVKSNKINYFDRPEAESFVDFKHDKFGVMFKNTGTIMRDNKQLNIREERKRNLKNREIPKEDLEEYYECKN